MLLTGYFALVSFVSSQKTTFITSQWYSAECSTPPDTIFVHVASDPYTWYPADDELLWPDMYNFACPVYPFAGYCGYYDYGGGLSGDDCCYVSLNPKLSNKYLSGISHELPQGKDVLDSLPTSAVG